MKIEVPFKNPNTNEIKNVKVGWSWTLFFFSAWLGVPLFMRKLNFWGGIFLAFWLLNSFLQISMRRTSNADGIAVLLFLVILGLTIWIAIKGNEMTAKNYLKLGWKFAEPNSEATRFGKLKWGIDGNSSNNQRK